MAMHLDHYQLSTRNIYTGAQKLREETGLGFYDGGFFASGVANKIFPLGGGAYIEIEGVVDAGALADPKNASARAFHERTAKGECFSLVAMRVDTMEELAEIAKRLKSVVSANPATRTRPDGSQVRAFSTPAGASAAGRVNWYCFEDRINSHPSGQPVFTWPNLLTPTGVAWIEMGGTEKEMTDWIGQPASNFPYKFNGKAHGMYAIAIKTEKGEVVIRRRGMLES